MNINYKQVIKYVDLMSEQIQALEQQNAVLSARLNTAICLLCSNKASVVKQWEQAASLYTYTLFVEELNGSNSGSFSPESTPYQAVLIGIEEYIQYMADNYEQTHALFP